MAQTVLIVDDDPVQRRLIEATVSRMGLTALTAGGGDEALEILVGPHSPRISALLLDLMMPGTDGLGVLAEMRERGIAAPVIVQTAQGGIDTVVRAMRAGAFDFVVKPASPEKLQQAIGNALKIDAASANRQKARRRTPGRITFESIISASPLMGQVLAMAKKAARSNIPVMIEGESGVGKELIARAIQAASDRADRPFVTVNCGALPENLVESILFGHEKGAFTSASDKHVGKFEEANGGTLFLDEIGELPLEIQVKLLRAVQEGEIDPIGARKPVKIDIRLISATNRDLHDEVQRGRFREDLYYRLNVLPITVPALRDRREDVPALAEYFVRRFAREENRPGLRIGADVGRMLAAHDWPGNIRQLENAVFRAVVLSEGEELDIDAFPQIAAQMEGFALPSPVLPRKTGGEESLPSVNAPSLDFAEQAAPQEETPAAGAPISVPDGPHLALFGKDGHVRQLDDIEAEVIRFAIENYRGRMTEVARRLGIGRSTLYRKLRDYDLEGAYPGRSGAAE